MQSCLGSLLGPGASSSFSPQIEKPLFLHSRQEYHPEQMSPVLAPRRELPSSPGKVEKALAESSSLQCKVNPYVAVRDSQESGEPTLTSVPRQSYKQQQTCI